ncbi:unnamed protein product [Angiostrongylus costaricensis]|uniref:Transmembrane protein n=1 Tax=Angiostrongylus costaricensis TaxID=334426 RepID=A0A0R3PFC5_ANGCS|nr:unnamed protein product [Angiostrongylus costaricensis]
MVSPSCCLEYRPTATLLAILLFIVFPFIYMTGKVVGTVLEVLLRVLRGLCRILLWDDEDYDEENEKMRLEQLYIEQEKKDELHRRHDKRGRKRVNGTGNECAARSTKTTSLVTKRILCSGTAERVQSSDISESLNSECNTVEQGETPPLADHSEGSTVANGHARVLRGLGQGDAEDPTIT